MKMKVLKYLKFVIGIKLEDLRWHLLYFLKHCDNSQLTVFVLVHQFKNSVCDFVNIFSNAWIVVPPDLVDDLNRWTKTNKQNHADVKSWRTCFFLKCITNYWQYSASKVVVYVSTMKDCWNENLASFFLSLWKSI